MYFVPVAGLGFGIMSGAFAIINVLADSVGPGTVGLRGGGDSPVFLITTALITLSFILLHTAWNVVFFDAVDKRNYVLIATVIIFHFACSLLVRIYRKYTKMMCHNIKQFIHDGFCGFLKYIFQTLFNRDHLYWASIPPIYVILVLSVWLAFRTAEAKFNLKELLNRNPVTLHVAD